MNKKVLLVIVAMMVIAGNVWAAEPEWFGSLDANGQGQSTDWFDANMWRNPSAVPTISDKAKINYVWNNPGPVIDDAAEVNQLYVAESSGELPGAQTLEVTAGGTLYVNTEAVLGYDGNGVIYDDGTLHVTGGTVNCNQHLFVGYNPGATGLLHIDSGTVDVNQMFGLSWNGGIGNAELHGGTLITEEFTFEKVAGGTASMDITGGTWIQKHFWWDKIRALVWNGKITGYGDRANVVVTWDPNESDPNEDRTIVTATNTPTYPSFVTVRQDGMGDHTTIKAALADPNLTACGVIEVADACSYDGDGDGFLVFPNDVNYLTLQSASGVTPTITVSGTDVNTHYIKMQAVGQTIQGFNINFSGSAYSGGDYVDSNGAIIFSQGGASTVRDCNITGPTFGWIRGILAVATIEDTEISNCTVGVVCDINEISAEFRYSISGCHIHDNPLRGISFADCNAVMDNCLIESNGKVGWFSASVLTEGDGNDRTGDTLKLLITNSTIRDEKSHRNLCLEAPGTVTVEDCIIMGAYWDEILQYRGTLNLNRCIVKSTSEIGSCVNRSMTTYKKGGVANINHCSIESSEATDQFAIYILDDDPNALLTVTNSILTGPRGLYNPQGTLISNWNNNYCDVNFSPDTTAEAGPKDLDPAVDPFYIQTDDPDLDTFFALQPYSPLVNVENAAEDGNYMGAKGVLYGYEEWPGSLLDGVYGSDFNDFAVLASHWQEDTIIYPGPNVLLENFESYVLSGEPNMFDTWEVLNWAYPPAVPEEYPGTSTLTLLTDPCDANDGNNAMRWEYDVCETTPGNGLFTEILVMLDSPKNLSTYNRIHVMLKRHAGNSPGHDTFMYAKFLDTSQGFDPDKAEDYDVMNSYKGGSTSTHPDEYYGWSISLDPNKLEDWENWPYNLENVDALMFGIRSHPDPNEDDPNTGPPGGEGIIDVDDISLIDEPDCHAPPEGDLNEDCRVTFEDVKIFTDWWLEGK